MSQISWRQRYRRQKDAGQVAVNPRSGGALKAPVPRPTRPPLGAKRGTLAEQLGLENDPAVVAARQRAEADKYAAEEAAAQAAADERFAAEQQRMADEEAAEAARLAAGQAEMEKHVEGANDALAASGEGLADPLAE